MPCCAPVEPYNHWPFHHITVLKVKERLPYIGHPVCDNVLPGRAAPQQATRRGPQTVAEVHLLPELHSPPPELLTQQQLLLHINGNAQQFWGRHEPQSSSRALRCPPVPHLSLLLTLGLRRTEPGLQVQTLLTQALVLQLELLLH